MVIFNSKQVIALPSRVPLFSFKIKSLSSIEKFPQINQIVRSPMRWNCILICNSFHLTKEQEYVWDSGSFWDSYSYLKQSLNLIRSKFQFRNRNL